MMINVNGETETKYYYHRDALGNVMALSEGTGFIVEGYTYSSFGMAIVNTTPGTDGDWLTPDGTTSDESAKGNPYMFTGRRYDPESGLYYYRARYYDAVIGRFLSPDPLGYVDGMNLYAYVGNNPTNMIDPFGYSSSNEDVINDLEKYIDNATKTMINNINTLQELQNEQKFWQDYYNVVMVVDASVTVVTGVQAGIQVARGLTVKMASEAVLRNPSRVPNAFIVADDLALRGGTMMKEGAKGLASNAVQLGIESLELCSVDYARGKKMSSYDPIIEEILANIEVLSQGISSARAEIMRRKSKCP